MPVIWNLNYSCKIPSKPHIAQCLIEYLGDGAGNLEGHFGILPVVSYLRKTLHSSSGVLGVLLVERWRVVSATIQYPGLGCKKTASHKKEVGGIYPVWGVPPGIHVKDKSVSYLLSFVFFFSVFALKFPEMHLVGKSREITQLFCWGLYQDCQPFWKNHMTSTKMAPGIRIVNVQCPTFCLQWQLSLSWRRYDKYTPHPPSCLLIQQ